MRFLKNSDPFEMTHPVNKRFTFHWRINYKVSFIWKFVHTIFVGKWKRRIIFKLPFESNVEINDLIFEDVWYWVWIGDYTFNNWGVVFQVDIGDNRRKRIFKEFQYFLWRIFIIGNEDMISFTLFCTFYDQLMRTSISYSYRVQSWVFSIFGNHLNYTLSVWYTTISQEKYLSGVVFSWFLFEQVAERKINLSASKVGFH